jgi:hypothetical protein
MSMKKIHFLAIILMSANLYAQTTDVITNLNSPSAMQYDGNILYFSQLPGQISKIDITDPNPIAVDIVTGLDSPYDIILKDNFLYISEFGANKISKINITDQNPTATDVVTGVNGPEGLELNGNDLYIVQPNYDKISKIDITNINPTTTEIVTELDKPIETLLIGDCLYIVEIFGNKISKFCDLSLSIEESSIKSDVKLFPNPSSHFIQVSNLKESEIFKIYNVLGNLVLEGSISENNMIDIRHLNIGLYIIRIENNGAIKFIKE